LSGKPACIGLQQALLQISISLLLQIFKVQSTDLFVAVGVSPRSNAIPPNRSRVAATPYADCTLFVAPLRGAGSVGRLLPWAYAHGYKDNSPTGLERTKQDFTI
jgi:hypothetical protein